MNERLCIDCKFSHKRWWDITGKFMLCKRPGLEVMNCVTGKKHWPVRLCEVERSYKGYCNLEGNSWVKK